MKKFYVILISFFLFTNAFAAETYYCEAMTGVNTPLIKPNAMKKIYLWFHNGVEKNKSISDFRIVIDGNNSYIQDANSPEKDKLILFSDTEEKAELLQIGTVASSIFTIDKVHKKVLQAKNGVLPTQMKPLFKIDLPYQMIMSGNCR